MKGLKTYLLEIQKNKLSHHLVRYLKVNTFHVFFEMLITVYSMELITVLTRFFIRDVGDIKQMFIIMVTPMIFTLSVSFIFSGLFAAYYTKRVYDYIQKTLKSGITITSIMKLYKKEVIIVHIVGILFYIATSYGVSWWLSSIYSPNAFLDSRYFTIWMTVIGGGLGIIWNFTGIFRDQRVLWSRCFPKLSNSETFKEVATKNYLFLCWNVIGNILSLAILFILIAVSFFSINRELEIKSLTTDYWFLIIYYFTLIALYVKQGFAFLYSKKNKKEAMFTPLKEIILQLSKEDEKEKACGNTSPNS